MKNKLKRARIESGFSQQGLADLIGASRSAVSAWERGTRMPSSEYVYMYQKVLQLKKDYFCELPDTDYVPGKCFDISKLNVTGLKKLYDFYETLLLDEKNLRK